jgi:hypothetical protein
MIRQRQKNQVLNNLFLTVLLCILGCVNNDNSIYGLWQVKSQDVKIKEEFDFVRKASPGVLENKFKGMFPGGLNEGDQIRFNEKGEIFVNSTAKYYYKKSDTLLYVSNVDVAYPLVYELKRSEMILKRETYQGIIEWRLVKK